MPRIVGNADGYTFHLKQYNGRYSAEHTIWLPSVTKVIKTILASDALMRWQYTFTRDAIAGYIGEASRLEGFEPDLLSDSDALEEALKVNRMRPMDFRDEAGDRGSAAHEVLEHLAAKAMNGSWEEGLEHAERILKNPSSDQFQRAVAEWWLERQPIPRASEQVVYSLEPHGGYAGSFDLLYEELNTGRTALSDLKTRKEGGTAYESEEIQVAAYDAAYSRMFGTSIDRRTILVAREDGSWLEQEATLPPAAFFHLLALYSMLKPRR